MARVKYYIPNVKFETDEQYKVNINTLTESGLNLIAAAKKAVQLNMLHLTDLEFIYLALHKSRGTTTHIPYCELHENLKAVINDEEGWENLKVDTILKKLMDVSSAYTFLLIGPGKEYVNLRYAYKKSIKYLLDNISTQAVKEHLHIALNDVLKPEGLTGIQIATLGYAVKNAQKINLSKAIKEIRDCKTKEEANQYKAKVINTVNVSFESDPGKKEFRSIGEQVGAKIVKDLINYLEDPISDIVKEYHKRMPSKYFNSCLEKEIEKHALAKSYFEIYTQLSLNEKVALFRAAGYNLKIRKYKERVFPCRLEKIESEVKVSESTAQSKS